jgi:hypothetical protein
MDIEITKAVAAANEIKEDSLLGLLYKDSTQPSVKAVGDALGTVLEYITIPKYYFKGVSEKARLTFENNMGDFKEKLSQKNPKLIIPVNPQIGVPIIEKLKYITNEEIADLFTTLLTKASFEETVNQAHPAFLQILDKLSVDEARILKHLVDKDYVPFLNITIKYNKSDGVKKFMHHATMLTDLVALSFPENINLYIDNLIVSGIFASAGDVYKLDENLYNDILKKIHYKEMRDSVIEMENIEDLLVKKGYFQITDLGQAFIKACISN